MPSVDERVVQMKFDNKQFESGVSESERTLDRFKKSLDFKGVEDSLKNLEKSFSGIDLSGLTNAIDRVADRFSPLGILGQEAMRKISDAAIDAGKKVADAFLGISDMNAGQKKYETQTKAVQTITNATGKSVSEVEDVLAKLQKYTDETSYDFAEMVSSIGKFTSVGVELERAERAMEGIASEAAKSGAGKAEANRAMYNFAQALSSGSVKLIDWNSIENANMATKEFKETLIQTAIELGVLQDKGNGTGSIVTTNEEKLKKAEKQLADAQKATKDKTSKVAEAQEKVAAATKETDVNFQNFNQTLSEGWLTSDVLITTLEKYADTSTDFGLAAYHAAQEALTWTDAIDAVHDAVSSGWMQTLKYMFGDLDEARKMWTNVANALVEYTDIFTSWRNAVLKGWHDNEGYNSMIEAASNLWQTFMNIVNGVGQALTNVFPILKAENMTSFLVDSTKALKEWSAGILDTFGLHHEVAEAEEDAAEEATDVKDKVDDVKESVDAAADSMTDLSDASKDVAKSVNGIETGLKRGMRGDNVKALQQKLVSLGFRLDKFGVDGIFGPETQGAVQELQRALGVEVTGALDEATLAALNTEEGMAKLQERMHKGLSSGDVGKDVKDIQNELNKYLGDNDKIVADGIYGPKTKAAVAKLQKELGIEVTGTWDDTTRAAFESSKMILFSFDKIRKEIKRGETSDEVKALQEQLIKTGYLTDQSVADGIYGPKTEEAIKKLQKELGVQETGIWDEATYHAVARAKRLEKANLEVANSAAEATDIVNETSEETESSSEKVDKATSQTTLAMMRLQNIASGFASVVKIGAKFAAGLVKAGGNVFSMLNPLLKVAVRFSSVVSGMFQNLEKELESNGIYEAFTKGIIGIFKPFGEFVDGVSKGIESFLIAYDSFLEATGNNNTFKTFVSYLDSYLSRLGPLGQALSAAIHFVKAFTSVIYSGSQIFIKIGGMFFETAKRVLSILSPIGNMLSVIFQAGVKIFEELAKRFAIFQKNFSESNSFTEWLLNLDQKLPEIQEKVQSFCDSILGFLGLADGIDSVDFSKTIDNIVESIQNLFGQKVDPSAIADNIDTKSTIDKIKEKIVEIYTGIKDWITGFFAKDKDGGAKESALKLDGYKISMGVIGIAVSLIAKQIYSVTNSFISIASNVSKVISNVKGISKEFKIAKKVENIDSLAGAILKFAGAIGILAAGVFVMAQLKWDQLIVGLTGLIVVIGLLIGSIFVLSKVLKKADNIENIVGALLTLGLAIGALTASVITLSALDWSGLARGLIGTAFLLGMCLGFVKLLNKQPLDIKSMSGAIGLFVSLGSALNILTGVVKAFGVMDTDNLVKGFLGVAALLGGIVIFTKYLNGIKIGFGTVTALIVSAVSLDLLIGGFLVLTYGLKMLSPKDILKGLAGMTIIVLGIAGLLKLIEKIHPSIGSIMALLPVAISLDLLILGFASMVLIMRNSTAEDVAKAFGGIAVIVLGIAGLLKLIEKIHPSIGSILAILPVAISLDLLIFGFMGLVVGLKNAGIWDILKALTTLGVLIIGIGALTKLMEKAKPSIGAILGLIPITLALDMLIAGFVVLAIAMRAITASTLIKAIASLGAIVIALNTASSAIAKVNSGMQGIKAALTIIPLVVGLAGLAVTFSLFANSMKNVSWNTLIKSVVGLGAMALAVTLLAKHTTSISLKGVAQIFVVGGTLALLMFTFSKALERMKGIDPTAMLLFATSISEMMLAMSVVGAIAGGAGALNSFLGIIGVAAGLAAVFVAFSALLSIPEVEAFLGNGAEKLGKLIGEFTGAMKASEFETFNKAMGQMSSIGNVDQSKVDNAIAAAQAIADFGAGLPEKSLIGKAADFFFGSELKQFSGDMVAFGVGFNSFATEISKISVGSEELATKTNSAIEIANSIKTFGESLEKKPISEKIVDAIFGSELSQFSSDMFSFGLGFNGFASQIIGIENFEDISNKTDNAIEIANSIKTFGESLKEKTIDQTIVDAIFGSELSQFSSDMVSFGTGFNSYAKQIGQIEITSELSEKTNSAIAIASSINSFGESLKEKTIDKTITDAIFGSELSQFSGDMVSFATGFKSYATQINSLEEVGDLDTKTECAITIANSIKKFGDSFAKKTNGEKAVDFIFGSELSQFSSDMVSFATGFNSYANQISQIESVEDSDLDTKTDYAISIANSIKTLSDGLKEKSISETIADSIFGSEFSQFSGDMTDFASKFNQFSTTMNGISVPTTLETKVGAAVNIAGQIKSLVDGLNEKEIKTKIVDSIFGSEFSQFSGDMSTFASKFNLYATTMNGITASQDTVEEKTSLAISVATQIASFLETLNTMNIETKAKGIKTWFSDQTKGETVIDSVADLAEAMTNSSSSFSGLADAGIVNDVEASVAALKAVSKFLNYLSYDQINVSSGVYDNNGYLTDKLQVVLDSLNRIAYQLVAFSSTTKDLPIKEVADISKMISDFLQLGFSGADFNVDSILSGVNFEAINSRIGEISGYFQTAISGNKKSFSDAGVSIGTSVLEGLDSYKENFKTSGKNFDLGLAEGISEYLEKPVTAIGNVAQSMIDKVNKVLDEHSPSVEGFKQGANYVLGLLNGEKDQAGNIEEESGNIANNILNTFSGTLEGYDGFSLDKLLGGEDSDGVVKRFLENVANGVEGFPSLDDIFKSGDAESGVAETFESMFSYGDQFKANYSLDKMLQGDLKYGDRGAAVKQMQEMLMNLGYNLDKFGADGIFGPETQAAVNAFKKDMGLAMDGTFDSQAYLKITEALTGTQASASYSEAGNKIFSLVSEAFGSGDTTSVDKLVTNMLSALHDKNADFKTAGENFVKGLTNGVYFQTKFAIEAAAYVARQMVTSVKNTFQTASPSKVMTQVGKYFSEGLGIGVTEEGKTAINSSKDVAENMIKTTKDALMPLSTLLLDDIDDTPVIRPVVDLTDVQNAKNALPGYFNTNLDTVTVSARVAKQLAGNIELQHERGLIGYRRNNSDYSNESGNGKYRFVTSETRDPMLSLGAKFDKLAEMMSSMKVVLDTGEVVGATSSAYDKQFGVMAGRRERGN